MSSEIVNILKKKKKKKLRPLAGPETEVFLGWPFYCYCYSASPCSLHGPTDRPTATSSTHVARPGAPTSAGLVDVVWRGGGVCSHPTFL